MVCSKTALLLALASITPNTLAQNVFDWDCTKSLGTCNNACYYVNCKGLSPGMYTYDPDNADSQRVNSGCSQNPCNNEDLPYSQFGDSCDEFPFATVKEGGTGASLRCVDSGDQNSEGGQLSSFYSNLNSGDQFTISISNYGGSQYCPDEPDCTNDGDQFILQDGQFVNNRRRGIRGMSREKREASTGFQLNNGTASKVPLRKFLGEDGVERLWLSHDEKGTLVGKTVWSETNGEVKIMKEIVI